MIVEGLFSSSMSHIEKCVSSRYIKVPERTAFISMESVAGTHKKKNKGKTQSERHIKLIGGVKYVDARYKRRYAFKGATFSYPLF